ncbi:MAG: 50S ribosomal protein L6 [Pseudomonadota bacterium]|jgi:large subunit ribosomal protein L6
MSRIGKLPVALPQGVKGAVSGSVVSIEGPKGKLSFAVRPGIKVELVDGSFVVSMTGSDAQAKADYGTARATINNMVKGVSTGWKKTLELNGVGYTAKLQGKNLVLAVGFSHDVTMQVPDAIKCTVNKNVVELESSDREILGTFAAKVRDVQPPEPYLGKGIKYSDEKIRRKAGKTGKK